MYHILSIAVAGTKYNSIPQACLQKKSFGLYLWKEVALDIQQETTL